MNESHTYTSMNYACFFGPGTNGMYTLLYISYSETYYLEKNTPHASQGYMNSEQG